MPITMIKPQERSFSPGEFIEFVEKQVFPSCDDLHIVTRSLNEICFYGDPMEFAVEALSSDSLKLEGLEVSFPIRTTVSPSGNVTKSVKVPTEELPDFFRIWLQKPIFIEINGEMMFDDHCSWWWLIHNLLVEEKISFGATKTLFKEIGKSFVTNRGGVVSSREMIFLFHYLQSESQG